LLMMGRDMRAMDPTQLLFWGVMSLGIIAGYILAYPSNVWMVARSLKHGLMTERKPGSKFAAQAPKPDGKRPAADPHAGHDMAAMKSDDDIGGQMSMKSDATRPQVVALGMVSLVALAAGMVAPANFVNMRLSTRDVGDSIMPPGMIMDRTTPGEAMRDMAATNPNDVRASYGLNVRGDRPLGFRLENRVKVFDLTASVIRWTILPGVSVDGYAYNGQIPGPRIHIREGDRVRIDVHNQLPEITTIHWHGLILPNQMDGPAYVTQAPIEPGGNYSYAFTATQHGTYFYHPHAKPDRTQALGLYGALIIDPADPAAEVKSDHEYVVQLQEWLLREGLTFPSMPMEGGLPNYFTINGKAYPATETIKMKVGETLKVRFIGTNNNDIHPMHIHGGPFQVVAVDGETLAPAQRYMADTVLVGPGQRYDVVWLARRPGKWLIHCHIPHHTSNNNVEMQGGGGLMAIIDVE
ncbi:MAG: multicopper oxidase domain-containing protein, partial [Novosphingobium sp.]